MSLFGASQPQQTPAGQGLSGAGGAASQPQQSSLFGGSSTASTNPQQQTSSGGLFGTGGAAASRTTPGSLFGSTTASQSQQQSLPSGGLFGRVNSNQPQTTSAQGTQAPLAGSLFGSASTTQPATQPTTTNAGNSFAASGAGTAQSQPLQQSQGLSQSTASPSHIAYFDHMVERGKKRQNAESTAAQLGDLPALQLGLGDISSKIRNLGGGGSVRRQGRGGDARAHYLLAASGVATGAALRDLDSIAVEAGNVPSATTAAAFDPDLEGYLNSRREKSTLDLIAETIEETKRDFDTFLEEHVQMNWDEQRRRIYEHFGLAKPEENLDSTFGATTTTTTPRGAFGRSSRRSKASQRFDGSLSGKQFGSPMSKSVLGASVSRNSVNASPFTDVATKSTTTNATTGIGDPAVRSKQEKYAAKIKELNSARLQEIVYPLIEEFANVEIDMGNDSSYAYVDAYRALKEITKETAKAHRPSDPGAIKERQYAQIYLDETPNSANGLELRKLIVNGSRIFLEQQFFRNMEEMIAKNPREANLGGVPSKINKVRAYLRIRTARKDLGADTYELQSLDDDYCWALIFYMLRCGLFQEAAQYVAENERAIKSMDRNFPQYMATYARDPERRLPREMQTRINAEYNQRSRLAPDNSIDPYRMACYKIVGRCDLARKSFEGIETQMQDWVWLLFSLAREVNRVEESAGEVFGLSDIQALIEDVGQRYYSQSAGDTNGAQSIYFLVQILAGMFEKAIVWLYAYDYVVATHFAIALDFYGLLRVSNFTLSETDLLTYTTREKPQIGFARLMGYYTRDFRMARAEAAADYITLMCLNSDLPGDSGTSQVRVCHEALKDLVLETREFAQLLGDIRSDGVRIKGAIEQRLNLLRLKDQDQDEFLKTLTTQAAAIADDNGRTTDAVLLYHLAEDYDNVIAIVNRALSDAIAVDIGQEQLRLQPLKPRAPDQQPADKSNGSNKGPQTSLSLTSVDDPAVLAKNMISLYDTNALYFRKIRPVHREACGVLLRMSMAKASVAAGKWAEALDTISSLDLLPLQAASNMSAIRASAQAFNNLPSVIAGNIGSLLMWTIICCGRQSEILQASEFEDRTRKAMIDQMKSASVDLMVFAGLIRYKLPPRVYEQLARAGQEAGAY